MRQRLNNSSSVYFSLTVKNQKDEHLSITMDDERRCEADMHNILADGTASPPHLADLGFHHFMTFDLLMDTSAGYLLNGHVLVCASIRLGTEEDAQRAHEREADATGQPDSSSGSASSGDGYIQVKIAVEGDLLRHLGPGLVDFGAVHEFAVPGSTRASVLSEMIAADLCFASCAIHPCLVDTIPETEGVRGERARGAGARCGHAKLLPPLSEVQLVRSVADLVRPLGSLRWHLVVLPKDPTSPSFGEREEGERERGGGSAPLVHKLVLVFLKFYDPASQSLEFIGQLQLEASTMLSALIRKVNSLIGLAPREALMGFEEVRGVARPLQGDGGADISLGDFGLDYGAILCFQVCVCFCV
jgi:hypothetical protein